MTAVAVLEVPLPQRERSHLVRIIQSGFSCRDQRRTEMGRLGNVRGCICPEACRID
jgi:hypothetical protein